MNNTIINDAVKDVTLDSFLSRHPSLLKSDTDYPALVQKLRDDRARFIDAQEKKKMKKEGMVEVEGDDDSAE